MSVLALETVIARLCVDHKFRRAFAIDRAAALQPFDLSHQERTIIDELDMNAVGEYAGNLVAKRIGLIRKWLPLTTSLLHRELGDGFQEIMQQYGLEKIRDDDSIGGDWVRHESVRVCDYLRQLVAERTLDIRYFIDVLEFEFTKLSMMNDPEVLRAAVEYTEHTATHTMAWDSSTISQLRPMTGKHVRIKDFACDMSRLIVSLADEESTPELEEENTWVLFFKKPGLLQVSTSTLNLPSRDVLQMSDGRATLEEIEETLFRCYGDLYSLTREEIISECMFLVTRLYEEGAIVFV